MNRPERFDKGFRTKARNNMKTWEFIRCEEEYINSLEKYIDALEKALDKACERLRDFDEIDQLKYGLRRPRDIEEWKEWALEDEK